MNDPIDNHTVFLTVVRTQYGKTCARLLIESLRTFGGAMNQYPFWLFEADSEKTPCRDLESLGANIFALDTPGPVSNYLFGHKVYACAQAELLAPPGTHSLVWVDANCLIIQPPLLFDLGTDYDAAFRPVHIRNVGSPADQPLDAFWQKIYDVVGIKDMPMTVESFVDGQRLRAYFNSLAFAFNPAKELMKRWLKCFETLVSDRSFQSNVCQDEDHQVFLFQSSLSTIIASSIEMSRFRFLPPEYNYPLNLQESVPPMRRANVLNNLVNIAYEDHSLNPHKAHDIEIQDPLRSWLLERENFLPENV